MYKEYQSLLLKNTRIHDINCQYKGSYMWWVGDLGFNPNLPILDGKSDYELSRGFKIERIWKDEMECSEDIFMRRH